MVTTLIRVRDATSADRREIITINRLAWQCCYSHIFSPEEISGLFCNALPQKGSWLHRRKNHLGTLIAEVDGVIVGFIGLASLTHPKQAEITTLYLHPEYLRQGIGRELWHSALDRLYQMGFNQVWVWALVKAQACHFYRAQGCIAQDKGVYSVGNHAEEAIGFWRQI